MMTKAQYDKMMARMSNEPCGLNLMADMKNPRPGIRIITIRECNPPTQDNRRCGLCGRPLER
jgi:hypothetical protein